VTTSQNEGGLTL